MSTEVLLLALLGGITLLAYMIAINSHGPTRLSISYLLATILLAATVWAVVEHVNSGLDRQKMDELRRLEAEKQEAVALVKTQEQTLRMSQERTVYAGKISEIINQGTALAATMMNVDTRDMSLELEVLIGKAAQTKANVNRLKEQFEKLQVDDAFFSRSMALLKDAIAVLGEAVQYYQLFYRSEDTAQEELRVRLMRQKARDAYEKCQKANALIASSGQ